LHCTIVLRFRCFYNFDRKGFCTGKFSGTAGRCRTLIIAYAGIEEADNAIPSIVTQAYIIEILATYDETSDVFTIDLSLNSSNSLPIQ